MQLLRDLIRDLVGIIFPGGLLIMFTLWFFWGIMISLKLPNLFTIIPSVDNVAIFSILIILSYIAGQTLRVKRLDDIDKKATETYRKKKKLNEEALEESIAEIDAAEKNYFAGKTKNRDELKSVYRQNKKNFGYWEEFPYPCAVKTRRLFQLPDKYNDFFEKYDKQGITKSKAFFNFCKSAIYEYSPSFKEEMLHQESLIRLFAGVYYVAKYGNVLNFIIGLWHVALVVLHLINAHFVTRLGAGFQLFTARFVQYTSKDWSHAIIFVFVFAFWVFWYMNNEILSRLHSMRMKDLNLAYDAFYLINQKHKLDL